MRALLAPLCVILCAPPAFAHPHIFIDAKARIVFNNQGEVTAIENAWTFDEAFSAWQIQGLDTDGNGITSSEEMQELADENLVGLSEYGFYTYAGEDDDNLALVSAGGARFVNENGRSTLTFSVAPEQPYRIRSGLEVAINDPEYYVAITFASADDVTLVNAPDGCAARLEEGHDMPDDVAAELYSLPPDVTELPPELAAALRGVQGAIVVSCLAVGGDAPLETAAEAVRDVAEARPATPFGGPPPEPGFVMPRTGFFGWVAEQQRRFYQALTAALGALKEDNNAFWILGGLSFLYGVFHAAGPGHGKVVISSYVLANERQVRQGIALSIATALLQSFVAIMFVLVLAALLNLSAAAMNDAANWIGVGSYALVALLGLWLVARKLFGWGHRHDAHGHDDHHDHKHHDHDQRDHHEQAVRDHGAYHHVVTADQVRGGWREQLGVVLAVGLRPCSGALVVLAFALSQGLIVAGIAAVLLMGLGTALTVAVLASMAVGLKGFALRAAGANNGVAAGVVWWAELLGAILVLGFGVVLLVASV